MKVLFIGNSYQYSSNVDYKYSSNGTFLALAKAAGHTVDSHGTYIGGGSLNQHWSDNDWNNARDHLTNGDYDVVVINGGYMGGGEADIARRMVDLAEANGTKAVFFDPWAMDHKISVSGGDEWGFLHKNYLNAAKNNDAAYAPVGLAYAEVHAELSRLYGNGDNGQTAEDMLTYDGVHPSTLGGYLAGQVLYATVFGTRAPGPDKYSQYGVSNADAKLIADIAWKHVQASAITIKDAYGSVPVGNGSGSGSYSGDETSGDASTGGGTSSGGATVVAKGAIAGRVFVDANKDGQDSNDAGKAGVKVSLLQSGEGVVATTTTDANGSYKFAGIDAGVYRVLYSDTGTGYTFTKGNVGNDATDSDVFNVWGNGTGTTENIRVNSGQTVNNVDAGLITNAASGATGGSTGGTTGGTAGGSTGGTTVPKPVDTTALNEIKGTWRNETLNGTSDNDAIYGGNGNDVLMGRGGDDYLVGGYGADALYGGAGNDTLEYGRANTILNGGSGVDTLIFLENADMTKGANGMFSIEVFDLNNGSAQNLKLDYRALLQAKDADLIIKADARDTITIEDMSVRKMGTFTSAGEDYTTYRATGGSHTIDFAVDSDASVVAGDMIF